jgi:NAD(P)-dependent dehydrogenase (short-subunit alcohol dehydrogenase family)
LAGRIALVTGARQGIGTAIPVALAEKGADVAITWLDDGPAATAVAGRIRQAGRRAHLIRINISSQAIRGAVRGVHYSASKGGVVSMTRAMALELAPHNICVNAIAPGTTDTAQPRFGNTEAESIEMARTIPLGGKMLTPDQIARTVVFLASDDVNAMTGQILHINGGSYTP